MRRPLAISAVVLLLVGGAAPSTEPSAPIARWYAELADPDPAVRDRACEQLMGLPAEALPTLLAVVAASDRHPAQAAVLREIVTQVFLAAQPYEVAEGAEPADEVDGPRYIMGQNWPWGTRIDGDGLGVPVVNRWPGFPARRFFRDGDLVLGVYDNSTAPPDRPPDVQTPSTYALVNAMRRCPTRPRLTFAVLRDGRTIRVTGTMVPEPRQTVNRRSGSVAGFLAARQTLADAYWDAHFAPVVDPPAERDGAPAPDSTDGHQR